MNRRLLIGLGTLLLSVSLVDQTQAQTTSDQINAPKRLQAAHSWQSFFALGSKAAKEGDHVTALSYFDQALQLAGEKPFPTLIYNRAVTLYKLNRYQDSALAFKQLLAPGAAATNEQQQWADLARYNLGLVALKQNQTDDARRWFRQLQQSQTNTRLQALAERQLANLPATSARHPSQETAKGSVFASLGISRDDNASGLANELANQLSNATDTYLNALAYGHYYVSGNPKQGIKIYGLTQIRHYSEFESFNSQVSGLGLNRETSTQDWTLESGGRWLQSQLDGQSLSDQYSVIGRATHPQAKGQWELSYQASFIDAAPLYQYIEGWQHQLHTAWQWRSGTISITPAFTWEINQREDKKTQQQFYSYSPNVLTASIASRWNINNDWQVYTQLDRAEARFSGTNKSRDLGGIEKERARRYQRTQWKLGTGFRFAPHWYLKAEYTNTQTDDNFELYSYDRNLLSIKLDYGW